MSATQACEVDLDPDFEQEQDHSDICEELKLPSVGDESRGERGDSDTEGEIADNRR
jgi:hypothetical protein